jgi:DNA-directed RNA polymerase specialized sigma24 family protein
MRSIPVLNVKRVIAPSETAVLRGLVKDVDLLRLKAIARLHARGLPAEITWEDLLQEAFTRVLGGSRQKPPDVPMVAFMAGVMRSVRAEHCRRSQRHRVCALELDGNTDGNALTDRTPDPERAAIAVQELAAIERLFSDDPIALQIILGLGEGLSSEEIRRWLVMKPTDYDSARKRIRRQLFKQGLTTCPIE